MTEYFIFAKKTQFPAIHEFFEVWLVRGCIIHILFKIPGCLSSDLLLWEDYMIIFPCKVIHYMNEKTCLNDTWNWPPSHKIDLPHMKLTSLTWNWPPSHKIDLPHKKFTSLTWNRPPLNLIDLPHIRLTSFTLIWP